MRNKKMAKSPFTQQERDILLTVAEWLQNNDRDELQAKCNESNFIPEELVFTVEGGKFIGNTLGYLLAHFPPSEHFKARDCDYANSPHWEIKRGAHPVVFRSVEYLTRVIPTGNDLFGYLYCGQIEQKWIGWKGLAARFRMFAAWKYSIGLLHTKLFDAFFTVERESADTILHNKIPPAEFSAKMEEIYGKYYQA